MTIRAALLRAIGRTEAALAARAALPDTYEPEVSPNLYKKLCSLLAALKKRLAWR
jgi:hypothetical protein